MGCFVGIHEQACGLLVVRGSSTNLTDMLSSLAQVTSTQATLILKEEATCSQPLEMAET